MLGFITNYHKNYKSTVSNGPKEASSSMGTLIPGIAGNARRSGPGPPNPTSEGLTTSNGPKNAPSSKVTPCLLGGGLSGTKNWTTLGLLGSTLSTLGMLLGMLVTPAFFKMAFCRSVSCVVCCAGFCATNIENVVIVMD